MEKKNKMNEFDLSSKKAQLFDLVVDLARKALLDEKPAPTKTAPPPKQEAAPKKKAPERKVSVAPRGKPQPPKQKKLQSNGKIAPKSIDFMVLEYLKGRGPCRAREVAAGIGHGVSPTYMILRRLAKEKKIIRKQEARRANGTGTITTFEERIRNGVHRQDEAQI